MAKKRISPSDKAKILDEVFVGGQKVSAVCRKWGISRFSFYKWAKNCSTADGNKRQRLLNARFRRGFRHYKYIRGKKEKLVLECVLRNPHWSSHKISEFLDTYYNGLYHVSNHGVANILARHGLSTEDERQEYSRKHLTKTVFPNKFTDFEKYRILEEYLHKGRKIAEICRQYHISRFTFYAWLKRYSEGETVSSLASRRPQGENHWRYAGETVKQKVIDAVVTNPIYSVHKLYNHLAGEISHHAIQNVLARENLNLAQRRFAFASEYGGLPTIPVSPLYEVPVPRLTVWRLLFAPFKTVPKFVFKHPATWPFVVPTLLFLGYIFEVDKALRPTVIFPAVALTFGLFFFLYSMKYYISLIIVMRISQRGAGKGEGKKGRVTSFLEKYLKLGSSRISRVDPLFLNLDSVTLSRHPFVSIHLAVFNEKRVIARLIEACQNQQWANYEVVVVDDSTDETTEIVKGILQQNGRKLKRVSINDYQEIYVSSAPDVYGLPQVKLIHRFSREGFKGAALQTALSNTNARAEYVVVFDSDFVPYPDTIAQFVKTFQESCGGLDNIKNSNIAAVQGYQWHVLNKSQNWVTRGVRSEYAGSYVIERAGIGVYGGLNMIAGSVFAIRADLLRAFAWGRSITEDFELTLRLYEKGYKVLFTPYIQAPAEAVSTVRRLIRQRMRWAEGHTYNIRKMASRILTSPYVNRREKGEFVYLAPYYLQAAFFIVGTTAWLLSEIVFKVRLPFWTAAWGWSLVFVNFLSLPLMNLVGLFLEESEERDYLGIASFMVLSYIVVPFQAYAAVKALFEDSEGPWFRTPKTGNITDAFDRVSFYKVFGKFKLWGKGSTEAPAFSPAVASAFNRFGGYNIKVKRSSFVSRGVLAFLLLITLTLNYFAFFVPQTEARHSTNHLEQQANILDDNPYSTTSTTYAPTDDSLGLVKYQDSKLSNETAYFEAVIGLNRVDVGASISMDCFSATDCKIAFLDSTNGNLMFIDCDNATCSSNSGAVTVDGCSTCNTDADLGYNTAIDCIDAVADECKIAYYDSTNTAIWFVSCVDGADGDAYPCNASAERTFSKIDGHASGNVLTNAVTGIVGDNYPINMTCNAANGSASATNCKLVYDDSSNSGIVFADCGDTNCSTGERNEIVNANGRADLDCRNGSADCKVVYFPLASGVGLGFRDCSAENCTTADADNTLVSTNYGTPSIECLTATTCRFSVLDVANSDLEFVECNADADCSSNNGFDLLDGGTSCLLTSCSTTDTPTNYNTMYCFAADNCKIAYYESTSKNLKFADCAANDCNSGTVTTVESTNNVGEYPVVNCMGGDIDCKIAFYDSSNGNLKFFDCGDATCTSGGGTSTVVYSGLSDQSASMNANLFPAGGGSTAVTCGGGTAEITTVSEYYSRVRTSCSLSLTDGTSYSARIKSSNSGVTVNMRAARIIYLQNPGAGNISNTQTSVEVGNSQTSISTTYADLTNTKRYCYDSDSVSGTACAAAGTSNFNPSPTAKFEATLKVSSSGDTGYADLYDGTNPQAEVTTTSASYSLAEDTSVTLTAGKNYNVRIKCADGADAGTDCQVAIANAHVILDQTESVGGEGITSVETIQMYNNELVTVTAITVDIWDNLFNRDNLEQNGQTVTYIFESEIYSSNCGKACGSTSVALYNSDDLSAISNSSISSSAAGSTRTRSGNLKNDLPASGSSKNLTVRVTPPGGQTGNTTKSWLIIQVDNLQVPEAALIAAPLAVFIPKLIKKFRLWRKKKKKKRNLLIGGVF